MTEAASALLLAKQKSGNKLYVFAWVIEIIAAFIGLMIAWSMGFQTYQFYVKEYGSFPLNNLFDLFLAALPFVMVAAVELLKIPFCKLVYLNKSFKIRFFYLIVLILVTFITFETLITGFERQFNNISIQVNAPQTKLTALTKKIEHIEEFIVELENTSESTINEDVAKRREEASASLDAALKVLQDQKEQYLQTGSEVLVKQKTNIEIEIDRVRERRDEKIAQTEKNFIVVSEEEQLRQIETRKANNEKIDMYQRKIDQLLGWIEAENADPTLKGILGNSVSKWKKTIKEYEDKITELLDANAEVGLTSTASLNKEINRINNEAGEKLDRLYMELSAIEDKIAKNNSYQSEIERLNRLIQDRQEQYNDEMGEVDQFRRSEEDKLSKKSDEIIELNKQLMPLKEEQLNLGIEIMNAYEQTQIYRIAKSFYGIKDGVIISEEQISFVAKIWFGSLAGIVSSMGIFLAFGALIFMYSGDEYKEKPRSGPIGKAFRKALVSKRKKINKPIIITEIKEVEVPKEVIKEVPVDKIVIKESPVEVPVDKVVDKEVPVEVVKKQVIHVPLYTNDPDLIKFGTTRVKDIMDGE